MSPKNDDPKISLNFALSAWLATIGIFFVIVLGIWVGATESKSFGANPSVRKTERIVPSEADDQTFSPKAKISASVGKGGKNDKQDVLLDKRLLSKFGY